MGIGKRLELWDAMDMVSPMSLEAFCKSMQVRGKNDGSLIFKVKTLNDWINLRLEYEKNQDKECDYIKIIEYCK